MILEHSRPGDLAYASGVLADALTHKTLGVIARGWSKHNVDILHLGKAFY